MPHEELIAAIENATMNGPYIDLTVVTKVFNTYVTIDFCNPNDPETGYGQVLVEFSGRMLHAHIEPTSGRGTDTLMHYFPTEGDRQPAHEDEE